MPIGNRCFPHYGDEELAPDLQMQEEESLETKPEEKPEPMGMGEVLDHQHET